ncbi:DUF5130 domain-containing protein [Nocardia sp. CDC159]|uniref:DUF5130 domain-containing protein n=1 Tax=Nocardia pulmonis TaxID=2951408 RepID=A0A9X2EGC3_9NOCA|nr:MULTISPECIES: DUF5130 domain-containing protein [Nocardia]MCM6777673.1 DUF5130 domain-containing protein [Nocardia pulmonis]MCM6790523.1 DUF5130 domain-containing protein [Nocardia sp. CDC159]
MASSKWPAVVEADLPHGWAVTSSGRVSGVHEAGDVFKEAPFSDHERLLMDNTLTEATRSTKVRFNVYIGDLGADPAAGVDALFPRTPEAARSVLIAVSPNEHAVEVRSGREVADRVNDRICQLGVTAALSSLRQGELIDGLVSAVRVMAAAIGRPS